LISIVIPVYNEKENLLPLYEELYDIINHTNEEYEIIFVDDGSTDDSYKILKKLSESNSKIRVIKLRRNYGQTAALQAGFSYARGEIIISMDSDLQNDPKDIPNLLEKIKTDWDVVCGWRKNRHDSFTKRIISKFSNWLVRKMTGLKIHDMGCTLRAYKRETVQNIELYGELHRYILVLISWRGFKITEIQVNHRKREHGRTKYGLSRIITGFLDLLLMKFLLSYFSRPMLMFGLFGMSSMLLGVIIGTYLVVQKYFYGISIGDKPLLLLAALLIIFGVQFICTGLIADMIKRTQYQVKQIYEIEETI
jgi:glycosyltransferase involved in cell wall biosynthesis